MSNICWYACANASFYSINLCKNIRYDLKCMNILTVKQNLNIFLPELNYKIKCYATFFSGIIILGTRILQIYKLNGLPYIPIYRNYIPIP